MLEQNKTPVINLAQFSLQLLHPADPEGWIDVSIHCSGNYGNAWIKGNILMLQDLDSWLRQLRAMNASLSGFAQLDTTDPGASLLMSINKLGQIDARVEIVSASGNGEERHAFGFELDQSYLPPLIRECEQAVHFASINKR